LANIPSGTVTFLFTDIEGSTRLLETLREQYASVLDAQREILRAAFARWSGHEIDTLGDSFFVAFARATDAIQCVMEVQHALVAHEWPQGGSVRVRMGLHTGEAVISRDGSVSGGADAAGEGKGRPYYVGMDVHRAARIASAGHGGQVLLSQTTRDLVYQDLPEGASLRDLGTYRLKDIRLPQRIYQLDIQGLPGEFPPLTTLPEQAQALDEREMVIPAEQKEVEVYRSLLAQWRASGRETLDKASLAMLLGAPMELAFDRDDLVLLLRSALQKELALEPWLKRASSPQAAIAALDALLQEYPRPQARLAIVEALCEMPDPQADPVLLRVAESDDAPAVRARAARVVAGRGQHAQVALVLARQAREGGDPAAIAALVAVIDEYGLPEGSGAYPRIPVAVGLVQRRWMSGREAVRRRAVQGMVGGGLALGLLGGLLPLLAILIAPQAIEFNRQFVSISAWVLAGAIAGMLWGGLQGRASGFAVGLADVLLPVRQSATWRFVAGGSAGMVFSVLSILFASTDLMYPVAGPQMYVPVFVVYGFLQGGALAWVISRPGAAVSGRFLVIKVLLVSLFIGLVATPSIFLVYQERSLSRLPLDWLYAILMCGGLALATRKG
jgi:class 3 adenylate cyclase